MTSFTHKKKHITRIAFTFAIAVAIFFPNLNLVIAAPNDDANIYPSTQAVKQVTFANRVARELDAKDAAQTRMAQQTANKAEQLADQKQQDEIARQAAEKAAAEKAAAEKAAAEKAAAEKAAAEQAAAAKAAAQAAAAKAAAAAQQQAAAQAQSAASTTTVATSSTSGTSKGTFKISFYDPAVLGSSLGYGGVAANLSMFPKGTRLKISMSNGQVLYRTVNDTGSFAYANPYQLDVAMPNSQIPSAGILSASVEVL
ncbi:RlpA-like double-psi beta-barrel domain-containing protein [Lapidilactobacillus gannanensis]|jgi:3D (Asp-Asp-Asp) domain-containing protein|uniref:Hydrolase n=1 Tax=Lapidilactobacillus gannanensis TaxID=2486002 RepID=A0ABW4BMQ0_9LACO|nr:hydrolase [Lapidilactobacillus gannanensis]MCH4056844.1 hydrolase [Lactobacillaceae bacterium]